MRELIKTPSTTKRNEIRNKARLIKTTGAEGAQVQIEKDAKGKQEVIIGMSGVESASIEIQKGVINVRRLPAGESGNKNGSLIVDLRGAGELQGKVEKRDGVREIMLGDDGMGAMQIRKQIILWVRAT